MKSSLNINLTNNGQRAKQWENVEKFWIKKRRFLLACAIAPMIVFASEFSSKGAEPVIGVGVTLDLIAILVCAFALRCPNCGTIPMSNFYRLGVTEAAGKGVNPFAHRCSNCGFYLSSSSLKSDLVELGIVD